jgi:hypothetical protein
MHAAGSVLSEDGQVGDSVQLSSAQLSSAQLSSAQLKSAAAQPQLSSAQLGLTSFQLKLKAQLELCRTTAQPQAQLSRCASGRADERMNVCASGWVR